MAECSRCKIETQLHVNGVVICPVAMTLQPTRKRNRLTGKCRQQQWHSPSLIPIQVEILVSIGPPPANTPYQVYALSSCKPPRASVHALRP